MNKTSIAIVNSSTPFGSSNGKEALDVAMIFGSYAQNVSLFFHGDGVWQLMNDQTPEILDIKDYLKTFSAFEFYDIENIYVCKNSLEVRNLPSNFHIDNVTVLSTKEFTALLHQQDTIFRF